METKNSVEIRVRFVRSDHSIMDGRFQGEVSNPSVDVKSPENFEQEVRLLVADCSSKKTKESNWGYSDDLNLHSIVFDDGEAPFGVIPDGLNSTATAEEKIIPADKVIEIVKRNFKKLLASKKEKYFKYADYLRKFGWESALQ